MMFFPKLLAVLVLAALSAQVFSSIDLNLERTESVPERLIRRGKFAEFRQYRLQNKQRIQQKLAARVNREERDPAPGNPFPERPAPRIPPTLPVLDYSDSTYVVSVGIGSPPQKVRLALDTTSSATWVVDEECSPEKAPVCPDYCAGDWCSFICEDACCGEDQPEEPGTRAHRVGVASKNQCDGKNKFNSTASETYNENGRKWSGSHGRLSATGFVGSDVFSAEGIELGRGQFAQATHLHKDLVGQPIDGVLGLNLGESHGLSPILRDLLGGPRKSGGSYTLTFNRLGGRASGQTGGKLSLGEFNQTDCSRYALVQQSSSQVDWILNTKSWNIGNNTKKEELEILVDSTTPFIHGTQEQLDQLVKVSGAVYDEKLQLYTVSCKAHVSISFRSIYDQFTISDKSLIWQVKPRLCVLAFEVLDDYSVAEPDIVLGTPLFTSHCVHFDLRSRQINLYARNN